MQKSINEVRRSQTQCVPAEKPHHTKAESEPIDLESAFDILGL